MIRYTTGVSAASILLIASPGTHAQQVADLNLDEIVVTASPIVRERFEIVGGTSVLTGNDLTDAMQLSLGETLAAEPGISSSFFGPFASRPIIRGFDGERVRILFDGIGSIDASTISPDHQIGGDATNAERIEVLRGPATLLYGNAAIGGVVNIIDGRIPADVPENGFAVSATAGYATNAKEGFVSGAADAAIGDNFIVHLDGSWRDNKDYRIKGFASEEAEEEGIEGRVENSGGESTDITGGFAYLWDKGTFGVSVSHFDSQYGSPAGHAHHEDEHDHDEDEDHDDDHDEDHDEDHEEEGHEEEELITIDLKQTRVDMKGEINDLGSFIESARMRFAYADYEHIELEGDEGGGTVFSNEGWELRTEAIHAPIGAFTGAFGLQYRSREFSAIGDEAFVPPTDTDQVAGFLVENATFGRLAVEGGLRLEHTSIKSPTTASKRSFTAYALSAAASYEITDGTRAGLSVSVSERPPSAEELFSNGPHFSTNTFEVGDPTLGKEDAVNLEFSLRHRSENFSGSIGAYSTWYDGFIYQRFTGAEQDELPEIIFTATDARFMGVEAEFAWQFMETDFFDATVDGSIGYVRATDTTNDQPLPRISPMQYVLGVEASSDQWLGRVEIQGADDQGRVAPGEVRTGGYTFLNAKLAYTWDMEPNIRFVIQGRNLTNKAARPHTSFIKDVAPLPGRDVRFYVKTTF